MALSEGDAAPSLNTSDQSGGIVDPGFEEPTVVFFYPEDGTPGCTREVEQFVQEAETYRNAGVTVIGVSSDTVEEHREFAGELDVDFSLVADPDGEVISDYDVADRDGRASRTTYVIRGGRIHRTYCDVDPDGHAREVLMDLLDEDVVELPEL